MVFWQLAYFTHVSALMARTLAGQLYFTFILLLFFSLGWNFSVDGTFPQNKQVVFYCCFRTRGPQPPGFTSTRCYPLIPEP